MSEDARIVSVIGGCRRQNRWRVAEDTSVMTLFGRCILDLREAECEAATIDISVLNVFANVTIIVPEGSDVRPSGMALLGSSSCLVPVSDKASPLPPIDVDGMTVFGRLRIG
ncbi:MAG: LiaF domain-containing protein, partial [Acidimicrobiales bacterium]